MPERSLSCCRVLLVEDEFCMALEEMLVDLGCEAAATAGRLDEALSLARTGNFDATVLDVNLDGEKTYPVADVLMVRGVPFLFSTGHDALPTGYDLRPRLQKPFRQADLGGTLAAALKGAGK